MLKRVVFGFLSMTLVACAVAVAQQDAALGGESAQVDAALFDRGHELYAENCAACHQDGGGGVPPTFPALNGNSRLVVPSLIVGNIHLGKGAMLAFPDLTADEIAALATYVRNAWENEFGGVTPEEVASILGGLEEIGVRVSVWDGVSTEAQAERGAKIISGVCAKCHGRTGNGAGDPEFPNSPSIARAGFISKWAGQSVATLFEFVRATMPQDNPGSLSDQAYIDAIAKMFALSNIPVGVEELDPDPESLAGFLIELQP